MELTLYNIRSDHAALLHEVEQMDGELTPELEQALSLTNEQFQEKAVSYGYVIKHFDNDMDIIDAEIKRLQVLLGQAANRKELFKQRLSDAMQEFGFEKITTPTLSLSFRKAESVEITDEKLIAECYIKSKVVETIDKNLIKAAIKQGGEVPGATLVIKQHLQIK